MQAHSQAQSHALPVLLKLLGDSDLCGEVPAVLARLLEDNVNLRRAASDADAVKILAGFLAGEPLASMAQHLVLSGLNDVLYIMYIKATHPFRLLNCPEGPKDMIL